MPKKTPKVTAKVTKKKRKDVRKTTAKLPQKPEVEQSDELFSEDDFAGDFDLYGNVSSKVWRVEKRLYTKQDGTVTLYYNYRKRKGRKVNGKRVNEYKKGGKRLWQVNK